MPIKALLLLLLPLFLVADIKFAFDTNSTLLDTKAVQKLKSIPDMGRAEIIFIENSTIYRDEAALYALKKGILKFCVVQKELLSRLCLKTESMDKYGFVVLKENQKEMLLANKSYFLGLAPTEQTNFRKAIEQSL